MYGAALAQEVLPVAGHWNLTTTSWEDHWSWSSYNYTRSYPRTQGQPFYGHLAFEANWKGEKVLIRGCLMSWQQIKIIVVLKSCLLILCNNKPFLDWIVTCEEWILYDNQQWPAQWLDWEEAPEHSLKPKLHQKKGHGHCLVVCCPSGPLQLSESWQNHYIWELGSASQWDTLKTASAAALVNRKSPVLVHDNAQLHVTQPGFKSGMNGYESSYFD